MTKTNLSFEQLRRFIALAMLKESFTKENIIFSKGFYEAKKFILKLVFGIYL
jgi:hypothetical protein